MHTCVIVALSVMHRQISHDASIGNSHQSHVPIAAMRLSPFPQRLYL